MAVETLAERYELEQLIGSGGMADVYRGFDLRLERRVAVKILRPAYEADGEVLERFRREARSVAKLNHPNLVSVIDRGEVGGRQFIVFEFVDGQSLKQLLRDGPSPSIDRAVALALDAGRGLAYAHHHGVIHRDVKPENILVGATGAKVTDFGIAYAVGLEELTLTGTVLGTSYYVSPEQAAGQTADARSDVYSLGVVLYELLAGEVPFRGTSFVEVAMKHVATPPPPLAERCPAASPRLVAAVERALEKDPNKRFQSMDDFVAELDACLAWDGAPDEQDTMVVAPAAGAAAAAVEPRTGPERERAPRPDAPPRRGRLSRRRLAWLLLVAAIAAGAVALVLGLSRGHGPATPSASAGPVHLTAAASYNPEGTGPEDSQGVPLATDGNTATSWTTEYYATQNFGNLKSGDGLLLEVSRPVVLSSIRVVSDTPGFTALIKAGPSPTGPFTAVSDSMTAGRETVFTLNVSAPVRYYVIWFTNLSPLRGRYGYHIDINEVTAT